MSDYENFVRPDLTGDFYQSCLARFHAKVCPRTYLEIGAVSGKTLALSKCRSVGIDPEFSIAASLPGRMPSLFLFQGTSDHFFDLYDPKILLGNPIDLAFLDGLHLFECLLREFINTERHCHAGSIVVLHDCMPLNFEMTGRDKVKVQSRSSARYSGWWTGDVWKTVAVLLRYRPDLNIIGLDAPPTGLIVIRNLDPTSQLLTEQYETIVEWYANLPETPAMDNYVRDLKVHHTSIIDEFELISVDC